VAKGGMQVIGNFEKRHAGDYTSDGEEAKSIGESNGAASKMVVSDAEVNVEVPCVDAEAKYWCWRTAS
jgi:hypothetical protein